LGRRLVFPLLFGGIGVAPSSSRCHDLFRFGGSTTLVCRSHRIAYRAAMLSTRGTTGGNTNRVPWLQTLLSGGHTTAKPRRPLPYAPVGT
ncbi:hypothetical protein BC835DRAFT_1340982, partial [Cytidiella melzeri]